ncbi:hypothetical protein IAR55_006266 [Kwoniella newhampshirensis]|uniref:Uncharacterized protein n=1 Tax=Kwoniella newhampshirensis TaxID=1651941 RepID=A0AAW0YUP4_9TREE
MRDTSLNQVKATSTITPPVLLPLETGTASQILFPQPTRQSPPSAPIIRPVITTLPIPSPLSPPAMGEHVTPTEDLPSLERPPHVRVTTPPIRSHTTLAASVLKSDRDFRSQNLEMGTDEVLDSPGRVDKGKARDVGERSVEWRRQTPRGGLAGPGGIMPHIASRASLGRLKVSHSSPRLNPHEVDDPTMFFPAKPNTTRVVYSPSPNFLRPAPATPLTTSASRPRFALSTSRDPSPTPSRRLTLSPSHAPRDGTPGPPQPEVELVEIPRFKKRELNLGIIRRRGVGQRFAWISLWSAWLLNGLLSLFFDANVMCILVQCVSHPSFDTNSRKQWQFATGAYAVLWILSTLVVWLGWEMGYEFWRRWRLPRPAIEPIYLSLPASLHLSLFSYNHFTLLLHIRTSPLNTPYSRDVIPETCHAVLQLIPGLLSLIPRAAIAIVVLINFWLPEANVQAPFGGAVDHTANRDPHFLKAENPGELSTYAKGVLVAFTAWVAVRLLLVIASGFGLWIFSARPLGGLVGHRVSKRPPAGPPKTPRKPKYSDQTHDPSQTSSPQRSWDDSENQFDWAWKERTRSRIQDAFELCMIRKGARTGIFFAEKGGPSRTTMKPGGGPATSLPMVISSQGGRQVLEPITDVVCVDGSTEQEMRSVVRPSDTGKGQSKTPEASLIPSHFDSHIYLRPSSSRVDTNDSGSAPDLFYTPMEGNTPRRSVAEEIEDVRQSNGAITLANVHNSSPTLVTELGMKIGRENEDANLDEGNDESTGLLSATNSPSTGDPPNTRDRSASTSSRRPSGTGSHGRSTATGDSTGSTRSKRSSVSRRRAYTSSSQRNLDASRGRSSSIGLLRESVANAAAASGGLIRRARSGTGLSHETGDIYSKMGADGADEPQENLLIHSAALPRSKRQSGLNVGLSVPFGLPPGNDW